MASQGAVRRRVPGPDSIGARFDERPNALNLVRLVLALEVVVWHAYALRGGTWLDDRVERVLADVAVDCFFAVSGFLICRSWQRRRSAGGYAVARARRILPGLWGCLLVTAFVLAPAAAVGHGVALPSLPAQLHYVAGNADSWVSQYDIAGGPVGVARSGVWNGSLWSLKYETACYAGLAVLGLCRVLRPRVIAGIAVLMWMTAATATLVGSPLSGGNQALPLTVRTVLMFGCGVLLYLHRDSVPCSGSLAVGALVLVAVGVSLPDYRVAAAPALAYLCIYGSLALGRHPRLLLRTDLSYGTYVYGFPVQQALLVSGVSLGWFGFAAVSAAVTLPVAALSWFLVERPMIRRSTSVGRRPDTPGPGALAVAPG